MKKQGVIFDLDGVLIHTDKYHYMAWKSVMDKVQLQFDEMLNNKLRGVARMSSLEIILNYNNVEFSETEKEKIIEEKNEIYKKYLMKLTPKDLDDSVIETLQKLKKDGYKIAIGSSSKNARLILQRIGIIDMFDGISDGTNITKSKPDPEVFLKAAEFIGLQPKDCLVVEDAYAGIDAGIRGGFETAGIGDAANYSKSTFKLERLCDILELLD